MQIFKVVYSTKQAPTLDFLFGDSDYGVLSFNPWVTPIEDLLALLSFGGFSVREAEKQLTQLNINP